MASQDTNRPRPVDAQGRIASLDVLRGFALLGILVMNIQAFAMIEAAYLNPNAYGDFTGLNRFAWLLARIFADQKFMTIFSILFGAGIVLMADRLQARGLRPAGFHYRRTAWLLVFGLVHAYLLWYGDVLVTYALCALLAYLFRTLKPTTLLIWALVLLAVPAMFFGAISLTIPFWPPEATEGAMPSWNPDAESIEHELAIYRGGWLGQLGPRAISSIFVQTGLFLMWFGWRAGGLMLLGMALLKWGVLTGARSSAFYLRLGWGGFLLGLPLVLWGLARDFAAGWSFADSMFRHFQYNYWGSLILALGYIGFVVWLHNRGTWPGLGQRMAAVGQMALTNYLMQTVICTMLFYGQGLAWFGHLERAAQLGVVLAIWLFQLITSPIWLKHFRFGPMEWLWRSLTYKSWQPWRHRT
jgi:uncharacterized protein